MITDSQRMEYEAHNVELFRRHGSKHRASELMYRCVVCGSATSIDDSFSNGGQNLICRRCAREKFGQDEDMFMRLARWMAYGDTEEKK